MTTIKIEKEVTVEDVYVRARTSDELTEVKRILAKTDLRYIGSEFSDSSCVVIDDDTWYKATSIDDYRTEVTIPQLAELLGVEYPLKPKFEAGKWYIAEQGPNIFCYNGKYDEDGDPCGYGVVGSRSWVDANDAGWGGDYREATPEEVKKALVTEAKRRYKPGDRITPLKRYYYGGNDTLVLSASDYIYESTGSRETLTIKSATKGYYVGVFVNGEWAEVVEEEKKLPTLEELIAEAKSKITVKSESYPCWVEGMREFETYHIGGMSYTSEKSAIAAYISEKIEREYL